MRIVVALGGNALLRRGEKPDASVQEMRVRAAAQSLAALAREHEVVITHGNGPQVGMLSLESESDDQLSRPYPLDVLDAQTEGMIGYWLEQALSNELGADKVAALMTRTVVNEHDLAFVAPTKFIGASYGRDAASRLASENGWTFAQDGQRWRRVVASPRPVDILEFSTIDLLMRNGVTVICAGGGGIPVVQDDNGAHHGVEAVVDKDRTSSLLARLLGADVLLILTDVPFVEVGWGTAAARPLRRATCAELDQLSFPDGSMGPKIQAALEFARGSGGEIAGIGRLEEAIEVLDGRAGTMIGEPEALSRVGQRLAAAGR